jgi:hypothetical protein
MIRSPYRNQALLALVVLAALGAAGESRAFVVSGTVRDARAQGISGVDIDAVDLATGEEMILAGDGTDATGFYDIFLPPGSYDLRFTPPAGQSLVAQERTSIVVMNQVSLDVTLPDGFFLFGTVRDPALLPIAGIDIDVRDQTTEAKLFMPNDDTDLTGFYSVVVPTGTYKVLFRPAPGTSFPVRVIENVVVSQDRNLDAVLQAGVRLFGTTRDPKGDPLAGVGLNVFNAVSGAKVWIFGARSDEFGAYEAALLPGTHYDLVYSGPESWGYEDSAVDSLLIAAPTLLDVDLVFPFRLSGHVTAAQGGLPVPSVKIEVKSQTSGKEIPLDSNSTDLNGDYEVRVPEGIVDVTFLSPEGNGLASQVVRNQIILDDTIRNAQLVAGFPLTGRVSGPGGGVANVDFDIEDPLSGLEVPVFDDDTDVLGDYTLVLPAGSYNLDIDPGRGVRFVAQVHLGVGVPHVGPLDFLLEPGVLLSGRVIDHISNPWPEIDLDVRVAGTMTEIVTPGDDTDAGGNYLVTVPVGTYDLVFTPPVGIPVVGRIFEDVVIAGDLIFDAILSSTVIAVSESRPAPTRNLVLEPNQPNPFNPSTRIGFTVGEAGPVTLRIYDVAGRAVRTLIEGPVAGGRHQLTWEGVNDNGGSATSGIYFLRLETAAGVRTQKMVLAR